MGALFAGDSDDEEEQCWLPPAKLLVHVGSGVRLRSYGIEFGATTGFAVWEAARRIADSLQVQSIDVRERTVLELGAGLALPSLVAVKCGGASLAVATDYPDEELLANVSHNASLNFQQGSAQAARFKVCAHQWGEDVTPLLKLNAGARFDVVILTDLIYKSSLHDELLRSVSLTLRPDGGVCICAYDVAHQPEQVEKDFFAAAARDPYKLRVVDSEQTGTVAAVRLVVA